MWKVRGLCALVVGVSFAVSSCGADSDIGNPCVLIRADPADTNPDDGIDSITLTEGEINPNQDYVSFGSLECEDFTCVRRAGTRLSGNASEPARGICSRSCIPDADLEEQCPPANDDLQLACRPLILDRETLAALKQANPVRYQEIFGDNTEPDFCVEASVNPAP